VIEAWIKSRLEAGHPVDIHNFMMWAFGAGYGCISLNALPERWKWMHPKAEELDMFDKLEDQLDKIIALYRKEVSGD
jgi:hypothetical protein